MGGERVAVALLRSRRARATLLACALALISLPMLVAGGARETSTKTMWGQLWAEANSGLSELLGDLGMVIALGSDLRGSLRVDRDATLARDLHHPRVVVSLGNTAGLVGRGTGVRGGW